MNVNASLMTLTRAHLTPEGTVRLEMVTIDVNEMTPEDIHQVEEVVADYWASRPSDRTVTACIMHGDYPGAVCPLCVEQFGAPA